jgi:hypothetical protein
MTPYNPYPKAAHYFMSGFFVDFFYTIGSSLNATSKKIFCFQLDMDDFRDGINLA